MAGLKKLDVYKAHEADYIVPKEPVLVEIGPARYLAIAAQGQPGGKQFQAQVGALYKVAFTVKMASKSAGRDYTISKLEGLWWGDDPEAVLLGEPREIWNWKLLIRMPDFITHKEVAEAVRKLKEKGKTAEAAHVGLETLNEGRCVQMLHVGPYDAEGPTLTAMHAFAQAQGLAFHGLHHEVYFSDPRRVPAARLRTILRHPVR